MPIDLQFLIMAEKLYELPFETLFSQRQIVCSQFAAESKIREKKLLRTFLVIGLLQIFLESGRLVLYLSWVLSGTGVIALYMFLLNILYVLEVVTHFKK